MALFTFEEGNLIEAGFLTRDCEFPILNLQQLFTDQFVRNVPIFYGYWKPGIIQRAVTSVVPKISAASIETADASKCDFAEVSTDMSGCQWIVPRMVSVRFKPDDVMTWDDAIEEFCDDRKIVNQASLITADGLLDEGSDYAAPFARWVYAGLGQAMKAHLEDIVPDGVYGNGMEFDGFETQLRNGWTAANPTSSCDVYNTAVVLNWATLTGGAVGTPVAPDAVVDALEDEQTLWGRTVDGFAGMDLGQFLLRMKELIEEEFASAFGGVDQWEWIVPYGAKRCIRDHLACVEVCGADMINDQFMFERFADYYKRDLVSIYPDDTPIMLQQTRGITPNSVIFGPRQVGGRFTYGWAFRNMDAVVRRLSQVLGAGHGYTNGIDGWNHPLVRHNLDNLRANFETLAFLTKLNDDTDGRCFWPTVEVYTGFLVFARHMWVIIDDVACTAVTLGTSATDPLGPKSYAVAGCADVAVPAVYDTEITLTFNEELSPAPAADDLVKIVGSGGTETIAVVIDYDALTGLELGIPNVLTDCATLDPVVVVV